MPKESIDIVNDSTGFDDFSTKHVEIGDKPARKMEAKSIMISERLLADLWDLCCQGKMNVRMKKGEAFTSPGVRLTHT
nr:hypothetical protein [Vibrio alfacsensis]